MGGTAAGWRLGGLALAWLGGVALHLQQRSLWPWKIQAALLLMALVMLWVGGLGARRRRTFMLALLGAALLGVSASGLRAALRMDDALDPALEGRDLVVTGVVASLPQRVTAGWQFRFAVEAATLQHDAVAVPPLLALGWYAAPPHGGPVADTSPDDLRAGQRWRFTVRLQRPHGRLNPHGYDTELRLFEAGVRAKGSVRPVSAQLLDRSAGYPIERLRQRVRDRIDAAVADRHAAGVLAALAVGDQSAIGRDEWDLFRNTGVSHLMSISGLHVTMFAWLAGVLVALLWRRSARAAIRVPVPHAARWGGLLAAIAYAVMSGWGIPSQRTVWMLATVTVLQASGVRWPWALVLLAAAVVVSAFDPWALLQAGFWLSFAAVGLLMASAPADGRAGQNQVDAQLEGWRAWPRRTVRAVRAGLRTQVVATLGLTPLTLVFFQQVSLVGFAANLVAIPFVTLVITPLALLGTLAAPLWRLGAWGVEGLVAVLGRLAVLPGAVWNAPVAPWWAAAAGLLGALQLVLPLPWRVRAFGILLVVPLLVPPRALPTPGHFDLLALDVGQGTAVVVRTQTHLLVYDTGPQYSRESDAGQRVLLPWLRAHGETRVDRLMLSHRDADHVGGARSLLAALPVDELVSSLELEHPLLRIAPRHSRCEAGQSWTWDGVRFEALRPERSDYALAPLPKPNALSCVVRISGTDGSALLTGDIERDQEAALVAAQGAALRSDVLIVPHHGSRTSSTPAFIDAVAPMVAVFQAGYRSRFGHPAPDVVERYRRRGALIAATPDCGAWHWTGGAARTGVCERDAARRYWHALRTDANPRTRSPDP